MSYIAALSRLIRLAPAVFLLLGASAATAQELVVVSAASFAEDFPIAPASIASAFGSDMTESTESALRTPLPTELAGVNLVLIDSLGQQFECPMFFASPGQINFFVPPGVAPGTATVRVIPVAGSGEFTMGTVEIASVSTGLFTATELDWLTSLILKVDSDGTQTILCPVRFDEDGNLVAEPLEMSPGGDESAEYYLLLFGTGNRGSGDLARVHTYIGVDSTVGDPEDEVPTLFNGPQGDFLGLDQTNAGPIPRSLEGFGGGDRSVLLEVDGDFSNIGWFAIAPNPNAPEISDLTFELEAGSPPELLFEFDFEDADGDLDVFDVVWVWEDEFVRCRTSLALTAGSLAGDTSGRVRVTDFKDGQTQLGEIEQVTTWVVDSAGHTSNKVTYTPAPGELPGFSESCEEVSPR